MSDGYLVQCFNCLSDFDALEAIWCSCNPLRPSKVCPFCMGCFCAAGTGFKDAFWSSAPASLHDEVSTLSQSRMLIGEMLVRSGLISTGQLLEALTRQKSEGRRLGEILVDSGALTVDRIERFLQSQHTAVTVDLSRARVDAMMLKRLGVDQCLRERILPLEAESFRDRRIMTLAMADPSSTDSIQRVMSLTGCQVIPGVAPAETIVSVIRSIFPQGSASVSEPAPPAAVGESVALGLLRLAARRRASHIQIQVQDGMLRLFFRIDGTLYLDRARAPRDVTAALDAFRSLAGLEGSERLVPRVARVTVSLDGEEHAVIVRTRPGREGEEMSVKRFEANLFPMRMGDLGLEDPVVEAIEKALSSESGLLLIASPPWSGASTTLNALAFEAHVRHRGVALLESPRALPLPGIVQEEFFPEIRRSFETALARAADSGAATLVITAVEGVSWLGEAGRLPDRMLVVARAEGLTLPEVLRRLIAEGYPPEGLGSRPTTVVFQRLVRRICSTCRTRAGTAADHAAMLGLTAGEAADLGLWRGAGCDDCAATPGFRGRVPIAHVLRPDAAVGRAAYDGSLDALRDACRAAGMSSFRREALAVLAAGRTTVEEITRRRMG